MSEAKRQHSEFHHSTTRQSSPRVRTVAAETWLAGESAELQVLEPWENRRMPGGDPYNGIGARATAVRAPRR